MLALFLIIGAANAQDLKLWYNEPAKAWVEALPLGNSRLGAMVYGIPQREELQLNEETIWGVGPIAMIIRRLCQRSRKPGSWCSRAKPVKPTNW